MPLQNKDYESVLVVEDDTTILSMIGTYLSREGFLPLLCDNGRKAKDIFLHNPPDIIILDIGLPEVDGMTLTKLFRSKSQAPIIIISARPTEDDKVYALEIGADDYLVKPFSLRELVARIRTIMKRRTLATSESEAVNYRKNITYQGIVLNPNLYTITTKNQQILRLTKSEFDILYFLCLHPDQVVERDTLMREIMGYGNYLYDRTIDTHIKNLRKKIPPSIIIQTIRGVGYIISKQS